MTERVSDETLESWKTECHINIMAGGWAQIGPGALLLAIQELEWYRANVDDVTVTPKGLLPE